MAPSQKSQSSFFLGAKEHVLGLYFVAIFNLLSIPFNKPKVASLLLHN
jgi:hypothetical protein